MGTVDSESAQSRIQDILSGQMLVEVGGSDTNLLESGALDSVRLVELLMHLEREFELSIELETLEIEDFRSVRTIASLVARLQDSRAARPRLNGIDGDSAEGWRAPAAGR